MSNTLRSAKHRADREGRKVPFASIDNENFHLLAVPAKCRLLSPFHSHGATHGAAMPLKIYTFPNAWGTPYAGDLNGQAGQPYDIIMACDTQVSYSAHKLSCGMGPEKNQPLEPKCFLHPRASGSLFFNHLFCRLLLINISHNVFIFEFTVHCGYSVHAALSNISKLVKTLR